MDLLHELKGLASVVETNKDHEDPLQDLFQAPQLTKIAPPIPPRPRDPRSTYLVKLEEPLATPSKVQELAGMSRVPKQVNGSGDASGNASFCFINGVQKQALLNALPTFSPTFIHIDRAEKDLPNDSRYPCLGSDTTLPHHRPDSAELTGNQIYLPAQDEYPVWYFFYGMLAYPEVLVDKLELDKAPEL